MMREKFIGNNLNLKKENKKEERIFGDVLDLKLIDDIYKKSKFFSFVFKKDKMTKEEEKDAKDNAKRAIKEIAEVTYDIVSEMIENNCTVFVPTETSATPYGFSVKKAWKLIKGKNLKVVPINVKSIANLSTIDEERKKHLFYRKRLEILGIELDKIDEEREKEINRLAKIYKRKFKNLGIDIKKDKIYLYDESTRRDVLEKLHKKEDPNNKEIIKRTIGMAAAVLKRIGAEVIYPKIPNKNGFYFGALKKPYKEDYKNFKDVFWKEVVTRVIELRYLPTMTLKNYAKLKNEPKLRKAKEIEKAQAIIYDMKLIGEIVGKKIKKEVDNE